MTDIYIVGAGGHGREILWLVSSLVEAGEEFRIRGFVDDNAKLHGEELCGQPVLGPIEMLKDVGQSCAALGIGLPRIKRKVLDKMRDWPIRWPALVAPSARMSEHVELGRGVTVCAGSVLTTQVTLQDFSLVNIGCTLSHDVRVGTGAMISPGTNLTGGVTIGDWANIGTGADVIPRIEVGDEATVGAGAVVTRDVSPGATVAGCPAEEIDGQKNRVKTEKE